MPKYLMVGSYSVEGSKGLLKDGGSKRRQVAEDALEATVEKSRASTLRLVRTTSTSSSMCPTTCPLRRLRWPSAPQADSIRRSSCCRLLRKSIRRRRRPPTISRPAAEAGIEAPGYNRDLRARLRARPCLRGVRRTRSDAGGRRGPLGERDLRDQPGPHPSQHRHVLCRDSFTPMSRLALGRSANGHFSVVTGAAARRAQHAERR